MENSEKNRLLRRRKVFSTVFKVFSLSGILFAFQACYGTPGDFGQDVLLTGTVTTKAGNEPVKDVKVMVRELGQYAITGDNGYFTLWCERMPEYVLSLTKEAVRPGGPACDTTIRLTDKTEVMSLDLKW